MRFHNGAPTLQSGRLTLGPVNDAHCAAFIAFCATDTSRFLGGPSDSEDAWVGVAMQAGQWTLRGYGTFWVSETATATPVGRVGIFHPGWRSEPELSWVIYPAFQGRGFATEAALAARDWAYETCGFGPLMSLIDPANSASERVARRLGAANQGPHRTDVPHSVNRWRHPGREARA
ncbi:GNAT family N-acetyltransferase [Frigidibacter sp. SD6-1]|uniref:GNAT family N-acetyltransferase n=1 Tax=Frigidibacter sp. SD6-1 TaxID=3032581 RepID=UPI0024DFDC0D|nr:GNAT family N-acetyltransferase [Frigidibacter sp. SD6-1]